MPRITIYLSDCIWLRSPARFYTDFGPTLTRILHTGQEKLKADHNFSILPGCANLKNSRQNSNLPLNFRLIRHLHTRTDSNELNQLAVRTCRSLSNRSQSWHSRGSRRLCFRRRGCPTRKRHRRPASVEYCSCPLT